MLISLCEFKSLLLCSCAQCPQSTTLKKMPMRGKNWPFVCHETYSLGNFYSHSHTCFTSVALGEFEPSHQMPEGKFSICGRMDFLSLCKSTAYLWVILALLSVNPITGMFSAGLLAVQLIPGLQQHMRCLCGRLMETQQITFNQNFPQGLWW